MGEEHMCPPSFIKCKETIPMNIYSKSYDIWNMLDEVIPKIKSEIIKKWKKGLVFKCKLLSS